MTLEDILAALTPLLQAEESATITKSDDMGEQMIALTGTIRKTGIYDYGGTYVWYSQPGGGAWSAGDTDAMNKQLPIMLDYARTPAASGDLLERESREMTPSDLIEQLAALLAGGLPSVEGKLPDGTVVTEIDYGGGILHLEKGCHTDFAAWAITHHHRWPASKRDLSQAREALTDILSVIKPTK